MNCFESFSSMQSQLSAVGQPQQVSPPQLSWHSLLPPSSSMSVCQAAPHTLSPNKWEDSVKWEPQHTPLSASPSPVRPAQSNSRVSTDSIHSELPIAGGPTPTGSSSNDQATSQHFFNLDSGSVVKPQLGHHMAAASSRRWPVSLSPAPAHQQPPPQAGPFMTSSTGSGLSLWLPGTQGAPQGLSPQGDGMEMVPGPGLGAMEGELFLQQGILGVEPGDVLQPYPQMLQDLMEIVDSEETRRMSTGSNGSSDLRSATTEGATGGLKTHLPHHLAMGRHPQPCKARRQGPLLALLTGDGARGQHLQQHGGVVGAHATRVIAPSIASQDSETWQFARPLESDSGSNSSDDTALDFSMSGSLPRFLFSKQDTGNKDCQQTYFWQYNVQCKGPKGKRLCQPMTLNNPYIVHDFEDPVFDPDNNVSGIRHGGKARKGDGNDVSPNPARLYHFGKELDALTTKMKELTPKAEGEGPEALAARREKNKLASRVCRLKKKAQHEAYKVKLHGLDTEHSDLVNVVRNVRQEMVRWLRRRGNKGGLPPISATVNGMVDSNPVLKVAGRTVQYVNSTIQKEYEKDMASGMKQR